MVAMLIKNGTVQQKPTVTLTLIHAASAPPYIDSPLNCKYSTALVAVTCFSDISLHGSSETISS